MSRWTICIIVWHAGLLTISVQCSESRCCRYIILPLEETWPPASITETVGTWKQPDIGSLLWKVCCRFFDTLTLSFWHGISKFTSTSCRRPPSLGRDLNVKHICLEFIAPSFGNSMVICSICPSWKWCPLKEQAKREMGYICKSYRDQFYFSKGEIRSVCLLSSCNDVSNIHFRNRLSIE